MRFAYASRRNHATIVASSPGAMRATRPGTGARSPAGAVRTTLAAPGIDASTLRTVTGSIGFAPSGSVRSRMPKSEANFASGGASSVRTASGNERAFASVRPASSASPPGSSMR